MPEGMKTASIWAVWGFLSLGAFGWGLQMVIVGIGSNENLSDWVQAIGSVGAICAAVVIFRFEGRRQFRKEIEEQYIYMDKVLKVAVYAVPAVQNAATSILGRQKREHVQYHYNMLGLVLKELELVDYTRIESIRAADGWLNIKRCVALALLAIETALKATPDGIPEVNARVDLWDSQTSAELEQISKGIIEFAEQYMDILDLSSH
jgi:hypothetical protein